MAGRRVKFLTGSPLSAQLDWTEDNLLKDFSTVFRAYLGDSTISSSDHPTQSIGPANWRHVHLGDKLFHETPIVPRVNATIDFASPFQNDHDDFLEHSFAVLDNLQSSQIAAHTSQTSSGDEETTFVTSTSFATTSMTSDSDPSLIDKTPTDLAAKSPPSIASPITNLKFLPTHSHLQSLRPQTMTVNLIVGIILSLIHI